MSYNIRLLPEARQDIRGIIEWYNSERPGLGGEFLEALKLKSDYIRKNPFQYQVSYRDIRNAVLERFPYQIHYKIEEVDRSVIVFAVTHTSRNPKIWKNKR